MYIYYIFINKNINLVIDTFILTFFYNLCDRYAYSNIYEHC